MRADLAKYVPRTDMVAWHLYDSATSTGGNINDASGNGRHATQGTTPPTIVNGAWRGNPAWYWDGTKNPLAWSGSISVKHVFVIAALEESVFTVNRGLLSGVTSGDWLTTENTGTNFFAFGALYDYFKNDVALADGDWDAPLSLVPAIIEVTHPSGVNMDGIQFGQQKADTARKYKGYFFESLLYSSIRPQVDRDMLFEYFALKYKLWRQVSSGLDVWPFQPDWSRPLSADKLVLSSTSVSGAIKSRAKSLAKIGIEAQFTNRWAEEYDAAYTFWDSKYPGTPFIYRDEGFSPPRDYTVRFMGGLGMQQPGYHDINYGWQVISENIDDIWDGGSTGVTGDFQDGGDL